MILWGAGQQPPWPHRMLTDRVFEAGDIINNEVEAKWAGYIAQIVAPCALGPFDATSRAVFDCSVDLFQDLAAFMKPGVTFVEIEQRYRSAVERAGYEGGAILHGRGLGEDRPLMVRNQRVLADPKLALEEGMCFILKPAAFPKGTAGLSLHNGEMVELALRAGDIGGRHAARR
jgi:Xaa-Pro aminopeptidase